MSKTAKSATWIIVVLSIATMVGCGDTELMLGKYRFLSPRDVIATPQQARVGWIIPGLGDGDLDPAAEMLANANRPGPEDWQYQEKDYVIGPTDVLDIVIQDLYASGMETSLRREVSDSGYVDLPQLGNRIKADGLTAMELTAELNKAYMESGILSDPDMTVIVAARRQQTFAAIGAVMRPGTYNIVRPDMRLIDAIALVGGISQYDIEYIFIIRQARPIKIPHVEKDTATPDTGVPTLTPDKTPVKADEIPPAKPVVLPVAPKTVTQQRADLENILGDDFVVPKETTTKKPAPANEKVNPSMIHYSETGVVGASAADSLPAKSRKFTYEYKDGVWQKVPVKQSAPPKVKPPTAHLPAVPQSSPKIPARTEPSANGQQLQTTEAASRRIVTSEQDPFGWSSMEKKELVRVIAINLKTLESGDWRQNIVIRENDVIRVPPMPTGEFYVMGEVQRPGVYSLTGRKITLKMAVAAAGNLGPLAWPENSILIRRIGRNQEQTFPINLEKIFAGLNPDVYLKPNDVIAVGTHWKSSFLAVIRNAFRMTYGFGFIYDRNFSDPLLSTPNSKRFLAL